MRVQPVPPTRQRFRPAVAVGAVATASVLALTLLPAGPAHAEQQAERYVLSTTSEPAADAVAERVEGEVVEVPESSSRPTTDVVAELTPAEAARLETRPEVVEVVRDVRVRLAPAVASTRSSALPWGLDRIDQRGTRGDGRYRTPTTGAGTIVAVVDTGLNAAHRDFAGRVLPGYDYVEDDTTPQDCNGHGTHVAGTAAGTSFGAAPGASILALRVLDCHGDGYFSDIQYAFEDLAEYSRTRDERIVVNFSAGVYVEDLGPGSERMIAGTESAVRALHRAGVPVVTAAGNAATSACASSPGRLPETINVGASDITDRRSEFSDYGRCVALFAPGSGIRSAWKGSATASRVLDGTSMAAPHVAGVAARFLQRHPEATAAQVTAAIRSDATAGTLTDLGKASPDRLLYADVDFRAPGPAAAVTLGTHHAGRYAVLRWSPPLRTGGQPITGYRITRSGTDAAGRAFPATILAASARSVTFTDLRPGGSYTVSIAPVISVGTSTTPTSLKTRVTAKPGKPARPTLRSGPTTDRAVSVTVSWKHPTGDRAVHYLLTARPSGGGRTVTVKVAATSTSGSVTGLVTGRSYTVTVTGVNAAGQGPASAASARATAR